MVDLIPATLVYSLYGIPRKMIRQLAIDGIVKVEVRMSPDKTNQMYLYSKSDIEKYLSGGDK